MALRKLQAEIDKTLKAVTAGVEIFESTFEKLGHASNSTQKEKLENDLKTQIKKLQRMRDQIKAWLGSSDIKDKTSLFENRKLIETQMERFKALEKEMKMKAFSKEGLIAQSKLDPAEKAERDMIDWIGTICEELTRQIEQTDAESEAIQAAKKKKSGQDRLAELEELNERRTWHCGRLEVVQRMLENGQLQIEQVETIQEDVKYFVEANTDEDFDYDAGIYDELDLQEDEDFVQDFGKDDDLSNLDSASVVDEVTAPKTPAKEEKKEKSTPVSAKPVTTPLEEQPPSPVTSIKKPSRKSTLESKSAPSAPIAPVPPVPTKPAVPVQMPPIRYAAAAAAAVTSSVPSVPPPAPSASSETPASPLAVKNEIALTEPAAEEARSDVVEAEEISASPEVVAASPEVETIPLVNGHAPTLLPPPPGLGRPPSVTQPNAQPQSLPPAFTSPAQPSPATTNSTQPPPGYGESSRSASTQPQVQAQGVLGNLMASFDVAKQLSERRANDPQELHSALDGSYANAPLQVDSEPPRYYHPKNPVKTPSYYPQVRPPILEDKSFYQRLELDQLFYIFYYMTGSYEQWQAAQELKRQSWRFHKQYLTWFQRAHNPQAITEDYEQGGYFYFDWENSWCQRKKSDFRFEYRWLSDH